MIKEEDVSFCENDTVRVFKDITAAEFSKILTDWQPHEVVIVNQCFRDSPHFRDEGSDMSGYPNNRTSPIIIWLQIQGYSVFPTGVFREKS
jgi:hypothetical protein